MNKVKKNILWNLIGSFVYLFSQWLMSILVVRLSGSYEEAGIYGLASSIGNIFVMVANFSVRNYQVADIINKFNNDEYVTFRFITCSVSLISLPIYLYIVGYSLYIFGSVMCFMLLKICEALVDVFQGIFQKAWRLDIVCKSFVTRGIVNLAVFSIAEYFSKNLVLALLLTAIASLVCAIFLDFKPCYSMFEIKIHFTRKGVSGIFIACLPLFFHGILSTLIANIPRLVAQRILGEEMLGFYASVATPTMVVQAVVGNIFTPCISVLSEQYKDKDKKIFKTIALVVFCTLLIGVCAVLGFAWWGNWFLMNVFGEEILAYANLLIPAIVVSILTCMAWFVASLFTVVNRNTRMVVLELIITFLTLLLSPITIRKLGLQGINFILIFMYLIYFLLGIYMTITHIIKKYSSIEGEN